MSDDSAQRIAKSWIPYNQRFQDELAALIRMGYADIEARLAAAEARETALREEAERMLETLRKLGYVT